MTEISIVRRTRLQQYLNPLEQAGINVRRATRSTGLKSWLSGEPQDWIPATLVGDALQLGARVTGNANYGLWLAEQTPVEASPLIGRLIANATTLRSRITTRARLMRYEIPSLRMWVEDGRGEVWFCARNPKATSALVEQYTLAMLVHTVRAGLGPSWTPKKIRIYGEDTSHLENNDLFGGATILKGRGMRAISIPSKYMSVEIPEPGRMPVLVDLEDELGPVTDYDFVDSLRRILSAHLSDGPIGIEQAAAFSEISTRTLKRRLAEAGTTFRQLMADIRYDKARNLLRTSECPVAEISRELGYSNVQNFHHAFQRWSGQTPGEYRNRCL